MGNMKWPKLDPASNTRSHSIQAATTAVWITAASTHDKSTVTAK